LVGHGVLELRYFVNSDRPKLIVVMFLRESSAAEADAAIMVGGWIEIVDTLLYR